MAKKILKALGIVVSTFMICNAAVPQNLILQPIIPFPIQPPPIAQVSQSPFTSQELKAIMGDGSPRPGIYRITPMHNEHFCLNGGIKLGVGDILGGNFGDVLSQHWCPATQSQNDPKIQEYALAYFLAIVPDPSGGYSIRNLVNGTNGHDGIYPQCATVARGVVFGPSAIDMLPCESQNNNPLMVAADQKFTFERLGSGVYKIHTPNNECWDVRDSSLTENAETIRWGCNNNKNQEFLVKYELPIVNGPILNALIGQNYGNGPDGLWRTSSNVNIKFTGIPYSNTLSLRDNGAKCKSDCLRDNKCVSWVYNYSDPAIDPLCELRNKFSSPIRTNATIGGSIRH